MRNCVISRLHAVKNNIHAIYGELSMSAKYGKKILLDSRSASFFCASWSSRTSWLDRTLSRRRRRWPPTSLCCSTARMPFRCGSNFELDYFYSILAYRACFAPGSTARPNFFLMVSQLSRRRTSLRDLIKDTPLMNGNRKR